MCGCSDLENYRTCKFECWNATWKGTTGGNVETLHPEWVNEENNHGLDAGRVRQIAESCGMTVQVSMRMS